MNKEELDLKKRQLLIINSNSEKIKAKCKFYRKLPTSHHSIEHYHNCMMNVFYWHQTKVTHQIQKKVIGITFYNI